MKFKSKGDKELNIKITKRYKIKPRVYYQIVNGTWEKYSSPNWDPSKKIAKLISEILRR